MLPKEHTHSNTLETMEKGKRSLIGLSSELLAMVASYLHGVNTNLDLKALAMTCRALFSIGQEMLFKLGIFMFDYIWSCIYVLLENLALTRHIHHLRNVSDYTSKELMEACSGQTYHPKQPTEFVHLVPVTTSTTVIANFNKTQEAFRSTKHRGHPLQMAYRLLEQDLPLKMSKAFASGTMMVARPFFLLFWDSAKIVCQAQILWILKKVITTLEDKLEELIVVKEASNPRQFGPVLKLHTFSRPKMFKISIEAIWKQSGMIALIEKSISSRDVFPTSLVGLTLVWGRISVRNPIKIRFDHIKADKEYFVNLQHLQVTQGAMESFADLEHRHAKHSIRDNLRKSTIESIYQSGDRSDYEPGYKSG
ncbi:hypothetical protein BS50DRAFT_658037 [Corynespora cassiicola Philippines]|uniref:Uncharacterized protein n=1 Tax=Corynespora cassiicola Philippines TaxID=1448308 RepID=A0A2T2P3G6_CORCC|nr:hypothetical protein BS50DRAFT_658037 [Corynespora cassiicola Philippines]